MNLVHNLPPCNGKALSRLLRLEVALRRVCFLLDLEWLEIMSGVRDLNAIE